MLSAVARLVSAAGAEGRRTSFHLVFTACQALSWHTALGVLLVKLQMGPLRPRGWRHCQEATEPEPGC